jgi:glutathione S-transferase
MLKFYKRTSTSFTKKVEQKLEEMVIAHKVISVQPSTELPADIASHQLPVLTDDHQSWYAESDIENFLESLYQELTLGRQMQSDSCVIDPDNPDQCL